MAYLNTPTRTITLIALFLATVTLAQQSANLTLTFSPTADACAPRDSDTSITFTTSFLPQPGIGGCITLADVFTGNASSGYRNTSYSVQQFGEFERVNITYVLSGQDAYDAAANYSNVLYTQIALGGDAGEEDDERIFAPRNVNFYAGEDCTEGSADGETVLPWYLSSCSVNDDCQQFPFSVASFYVYVPDEEDSDGDRETEGKCVLAAEYGAGNAVRPAWTWILVVVAAVGIGALL